MKKLHTASNDRVALRVAGSAQDTIRSLPWTLPTIAILNADE